MSDDSHKRNMMQTVRSYLLSIVLFSLGLAIGIGVTRAYFQPEPEKIDFARQQIPTLMMHPLGRDGAHRHRIGNWELLSSLTAGNDSLVLKYNDTYIAALKTTPDRRIESIVVNHPLHDSVLLILERLAEKSVTGKLTTDILSSDGQKTGFVIDENMDGQPDLRFEYAGPYLYVWLDQSWHRVLRSSPRESGAGFKHTVIYRQEMYEISLEEYPYRLEPIIPRIRE